MVEYDEIDYCPYCGCILDEYLYCPDGCFNDDWDDYSWSEDIIPGRDFVDPEDDEPNEDSNIITCKLKPEGIENGVLRGRRMTYNENQFLIYLKIDPEKVNHEFFKKDKDIKECWLLYCFDHKENENSKVPEKTIS